MMTGLPRWLVVVSVMIAGLFAVWYLKSVLLWILIAGVISLVSRPVYNSFLKIKIGKLSISPAIAALLTMLSGGLLLIGFVAIIIPLILDQARTVSSIDINKVMNDLRPQIAILENLLYDLNVIKNNETTIREYVELELLHLLSIIDIPDTIQFVFSAATNLVVSLFSILFMLFFFLKEENLFERLVALFVPDRKSDRLQNTFEQVRDMLVRYFAGIVIQVSIITIYVTAILYFLGIPNALLIGVLAGFLNIIPYIGPAITFVLALILGILSHINLGLYSDMLPLTLKILGTIASMQLIDNYLLQPVIFSKSTNNHPLEIFVVVVTAGTVWGIAAMVVAVPTYTVLKIILFRFFEENIFVQRLQKL
jgi:predicted PurR-regulated permease PerM